ncbi:MAG: hypothetical protein IJH40_04020 [Ruminococcus sp.]|uniref:hypothetical protein n=1 Tax=Ruminococcus sp. TaxID=41978 RepID=UPI002872BB2F|nr:hypothetical protein [Ruminococcus sp.]MBQ3284789.1 hypothetical protein [Ruminococcus sp.]
MNKKLMTETKIYVGLNDAESRKQEHATGRYVNILKQVCNSYKVPFSFSINQGGYIHEDGEYTEETTIVISMIDADKELVNEIAKDLCVLFRQESVMITEEHVKTYFVSESIE